MRLGAGDGGDALDEVEDAFRLPSFLGEHGFDNGRGLGLGEPALPQEFGAIGIGASHNRSTHRPDPVD